MTGLSNTMGQFHDTIMSTAPRVLFDENGDNGLVICEKYIPPELLAEILCYTDLNTVLKCQLVCKRWKMLIQSYVWRKKVELTLGQPFPRYEKIPWEAFYLICKKKPFERNLVKNHSGANKKKYWRIVREGGDSWNVEEPPIGVPELPLTNPVFEGKQVCFVTSYQSCLKMQLIDLVAEGIHPYILDVIQPPIMVSEWYSCRWDCPAKYKCEVMLWKETNNDYDFLYFDNSALLDKFVFNDSMDGEKQNQWLYVSHVFENYGQGLRKISFLHGGQDKTFWAGHYGSKMAGACVYINIPSPVQYTSDDESDTQFLDE